MTRRAAFKQVDIKRAIKGALDAGLPVGAFKIVVENGALTVLPIAANAAPDDAADMERRMRDAFNE